MSSLPRDLQLVVDNRRRDALKLAIVEERLKQKACGDEVNDLLERIEQVKTRWSSHIEYEKTIQAELDAMQAVG